jgi:hypothetical protein
MKKRRERETILEATIVKKEDRRNETKEETEKTPSL